MRCYFRMERCVWFDCKYRGSFDWGNIGEIQEQSEETIKDLPGRGKSQHRKYSCGEETAG